MRMSDNGRKLLTQWEGKENKVYRDSAGLLTIGVGHLLTKDEITSGKILIAGVPVKYVNGLTDEQIDCLLAQDIVPAESSINTGIEVPLNQYQFDALCSFCFNIGKQAFFSSTLRKVLNQGRYDLVPAQLMRWVRAGGNVVDGLVNRRNNEVKLFTCVEERTDSMTRKLND